MFKNKRKKNGENFGENEKSKIRWMVSTVVEGFHFKRNFEQDFNRHSSILIKVTIPSLDFFSLYRRTSNILVANYTVFIHYFLLILLKSVDTNPFFFFQNANVSFNLIDSEIKGKI